jgi:hypothetical protein
MAHPDCRVLTMFQLAGHRARRIYWRMALARLGGSCTGTLFVLTGGP